MHHPTSPRDPFLPLDFRWSAARACVEQGRPPAACDDPWVREAVRFLAERGDRPGPGDLARLAERMPAVSQAFDLHKADPPHLRWAVEARLLAGESFDAIAHKCALLPGAVEMYERLCRNRGRRTECWPSAGPAAVPSPHYLRTDRSS